MNSDAIEYLAPEQLGGLNLYAYCNNNPITAVDPTGTFVLSALLIGAAVGFVVGFALSVLDH